MSEHAQAIVAEGDNVEALDAMATQQVGRLMVLEALAQETEAISPNMSHQSTQQGNADFEDD